MNRSMRLFGHVYAPEDLGLAVVTIDGGRVLAIEPQDRGPADAVGGRDCYVIPGLVDLQLNGAFGYDFSDASADVAQVARALPRFGVTAFAPTIVSAPSDTYAARIANLRLPFEPGRAQVLGTHIEGPYLSPAQAGTHHPSDLRAASWPEAQRWLEAGDVRIVTLAPEVPGALSLIRELVGRGVVVAIGHSNATWAEAEASIEAGASLGTHLFNAMRPFHHRDPGIVGYLLAADVPVSVIGDGIHVDLDTLRLVAKLKRPDRLVLITDGLAGLGADGGTIALAGEALVADGLVARLPNGTLSGSLLPLNRAVGHLVRCGIPIEHAIRAATVNPARVVGSPTLGRITVSGLADLTVVDADWDPVLTLAGGRVAFACGPGPDDAPQSRWP